MRVDDYTSLGLLLTIICILIVNYQQSERIESLEKRMAKIEKLADD